MYWNVGNSNAGYNGDTIWAAGEQGRYGAKTAEDNGGYHQDGALAFTTGLNANNYTYSVNGTTGASQIANATSLRCLHR